jgi:hypothetical protein
MTATMATPAQSPSMLSSRLKALVIPTIQTRVTMVSRVSEVNQPSRNPKKTTALATMNLSDQLVLGFQVEKIIRQSQEK